jgi:hypothetical protein
MRRVTMVMGMGMGVGLVDQLARRLLTSVSQNDIDLRCPDTAAVHRCDAHADIRQAQAKGYTLKPFHRRTGGDEGAEYHVAADPGSRVEDGKTSI